jgi:hypothetical protein
MKISQYLLVIFWEKIYYLLKKTRRRMGFIIFLLIIGAVCVLIFVIGAILSLFSAIFGYDNDPYERDLARMDFEDEILDRLERSSGDRYIHITDARLIHLHKHE